MYSTIESHTNINMCSIEKQKLLLLLVYIIIIN